MTDIVLFWMCESKPSRLEKADPREKASERRNALQYEEILNGVKNENKELGTSINSLVFHDVFNAILKKLKEDNYISLDNGLYSKTISGIIFSENGGYIESIKRNQKKNKIRNLKDCLLIGGSLFAGYGAIYLSYFEYQKYINCNPDGAYLVVSIFLILTTLLLLAVLISKHYSRKKL